MSGFIRCPSGWRPPPSRWIGVGISVAAAAYSLFMMSSIDTGGLYLIHRASLDLNPAKANTAKLGDAIREVFGRVRIYPDYVVQPVTRFDAADPTKMRVQMLLCLGVGDLIYTMAISGLAVRQLQRCRGSAAPITRQALTFPAMSAARTGSTRQRSVEHQAEQGWTWPRLT
ncbi:kinase [Klebsiella pneumoniae]|nr:kinase [Klebsiella pneumoniae]